jgi:hypothetical protein
MVSSIMPGFRLFGGMIGAGCGASQQIELATEDLILKGTEWNPAAAERREI